jgi:hypothetical protein
MKPVTPELVAELLALLEKKAAGHEAVKLKISSARKTAFHWHDGHAKAFREAAMHLKDAACHGFVSVPSPVKV